MPGSWEPKFNVGQIYPNIHIIQLRTAKLLLFGRGILAQQGPPPVYNTNCYVWQPDPGSSQTFLPGYNSTNLTTDLFCCGHSALPDGTVLTSGGGFTPHDNITFPKFPPNDLCRFDPTIGANGAWLSLPAPPAWHMNTKRWYPTSTTLWNGQILLSAGVKEIPATGPWIFAHEPDLLDPSTGISTLLTQLTHNLVEYPYMFQAPNGNVFFAGPAITTGGDPGLSRYLITHSPSTGLPLAPANWSWSTATIAQPAGYPVMEAGGSCAMYDAINGRILKCGGTDSFTTKLAHKRATTINLSATTPAWDASTPDMHFERQNHNLVLLPTGQVLAVGGNKKGGSYDPDGGNPDPGPVMEAEIFTPNASGTGGTWARTATKPHNPDEFVHQRSAFRVQYGTDRRAA
jgi:hypothetical protein